VGEGGAAEAIEEVIREGLLGVELEGGLGVVE
jgi:hypothetical protein